jgi:hypothetical protein
MAKFSLDEQAMSVIVDADFVNVVLRALQMAKYHVVKVGEIDGAGKIKPAVLLEIGGDYVVDGIRRCLASLT